MVGFGLGSIIFAPICTALIASVGPSRTFLCLWRFMIDKEYQGKGLGKEAMKASLDFLREGPCGSAEYCWLSYEPENTKAKGLYSSLGFRENGEICGDEIVAVLKL